MADTSVAQPAAQPAAQPYRMIGRTMIVQSSKDARTSYSVTDRGCTCPDFKYRGGECKHMRQRAAVLAQRAAQPMTDAQYAKVLEACDELF